MHNENWDDLRFVLAVAEAGTVSGAARRLGVNHATVLRRIAAFEDRHGVEVFNKTSKGYEIKPERLAMVDATREVANAVRSLENVLAGREAPLVGTVRISTTDTFSQTLLPRLVRAFHNDVSGLKLALISTGSHSDFSRSHADIAVRPTARLSDDLYGEVAADLGFAAYGTLDGEQTWLGMAGNLARTGLALWMSDHVGADQISGAADSFMAMTGLVRQGMGRAVLPCVLGDAAPELVRLDAPQVPSVPIWVACHREMAGVSRILAVRRFLQEGLAAQADKLAGTA